MLRVFNRYRPRQVAHYVKGFFRGSVYIDGVGEFEFDGGKLLAPKNRNRRALQVMVEVNHEIKTLALLVT